MCWNGSLKVVSFILENKKIIREIALVIMTGTFLLTAGSFVQLLNNNDYEILVI